MTQEVQPLTWQKRTNIEEHMQFFSKINEIIANLAPTVDEAEAAIAQATAAIASANDAVATANAASAAASAAASQAQTAATTVAGYDTRLTAAEGDIDALQAADTNNVKITGTHAIGNYAVLLTGNQDVAGIKNHLNNLRIGTINGRLSIIDTRNLSDLTNANIIGGKNIGCGDGQGGTKTISEEFVRVSGFGVTGGVEHMFSTSCVIDGTDKSVILRIRLNPATGKAQLMFGSNVISEVDL